MLQITIIAIGRIKEKYFQSACEEYLKRLKPYAKIILIEIPAEPFRRESDKEKAKKMEGKRILSWLNKHPQSQAYILHEKGKQFTSKQLANLFKSENKQFVLVIGGALGLDEEVLAHPAEKISLSTLTFPHELARLILLEQIYRAAAIDRGKSYHY